MGTLYSTITKDPSIDLYILPSSPHFTPGSYLSAQIYIRAHAPTQYTALTLTINGQEKTSWEQGSDDSKTSYSETCESYGYGFVVREFGPGGIGKGDYTFPVRVLLPGGLPGSFEEYVGSDYNCIKYKLKAQLIHPASLKTNQYYQTPLILYQRPYFDPPTAPLSLPIHSTSCCCCDNGTITLTAQLSTHQAQPGQIVRISGCVDNTYGTDQLDGVYVYLREVIIRTAQGSHDTGTRKYGERGVMGVVGAGGRKEFGVDFVVPGELKHSTSIGNIICVVYAICIQINTGMLSSNKHIPLYLNIHNPKSVLTQPEPTLRPPPNWNSIRMPQTVCQNMPPFIRKEKWILDGLIRKQYMENLRVIGGGMGGGQGYGQGYGQGEGYMGGNQGYFQGGYEPMFKGQGYGQKKFKEESKEFLIQKQ